MIAQNPMSDHVALAFQQRWSRIARDVAADCRNTARFAVEAHEKLLARAVSQ